MKSTQGTVRTDNFSETFRVNEGASSPPKLKDPRLLTGRPDPPLSLSIQAHFLLTLGP